jgi:hypothetical protein
MPLFRIVLKGVIIDQDDRDRKFLRPSSTRPRKSPLMKSASARHGGLFRKDALLSCA